MPNPNMDATINVVVRNRNTILFQDKVKAVTSYNDKGVFDIMPEHISFISIIKNSVIIHKSKNESQEIKINNGIVRVYKNSAFFYVNFES